MDEDAKVKERARQDRNSGHVAMSSDMTTSSREVADDAAARLDGRISGQRKEYNGAADKEAKDRARRTSDSTPGAYRAPPSGLRELSRMEADAAAKARAPPSAGQTARPGSYQVAESSSPGELSQMESDIAAKSRARPTSSSSGVHSPSAIRNEIAQLKAEATGRPHLSASGNPGSPPTDLNQIEADVAAKSRARNSAQPTSAVIYRESAVRNELSQLESDVAAKSRARQDRTRSTTPGAQALRSMEDAVAQKDQTVSQSKAHHELNQLEADVVTKQGQRSPVSTSRPGITMVRDLDERIAYKTGIPLEDEAKKANPAEDGPARVENVSKLTGIPAETLSAALEKHQASQQGTDFSMLENKLNGRQYQSPTSGNSGLPYPDVEAADAEGDKLAVAIAVKEDDDDGYIPAAIEYDPDAKPTIFKNRRFRLYGLMACTLLAVLIAGGVGLLAQKEGTVILDPTTVTTSPRWGLGIQEQLELVVGSEKLSDEESGHYRALQWIILEDPMQLLPEDSNLIQRFLLAVFYFKTHEEGEWLSCNRKKETDPDDICYFKQLTRVFPAVYHDLPRHRWLSDIHECQWAATSCDEFDQIRHIELTGQNIKGTLPADLSFLPFLQGIGLGWNKFYGTIPPEYGEIKHLLDLEVHYNSLTGTLPSWPKGENLQRFNIGSNDITGTLPSDIKNLSNLKQIYLFENLLTGTFPEEFAQLTLLTDVRINDCYLTGTLMTEIGNLSLLGELWLQNMPLTGTIPSEFGNISPLWNLRLSDTDLSGTIPDEFYNLIDLWRVDIYDAKFTGTISPKIEQLTNLHVLRANDNAFTGTLPAVLENMDQFWEIWVQGNNFTGEMPPGLCKYWGTDDGLFQLRADCLPSVSTGVAAITCECCDLCCDSEEPAYCVAQTVE